MQSCGQGKIAGLRTRQQLSKRQWRKERQQEVGDSRKLETAGNAKLWAGKDSGSENTAAIK